MSLKLTPAELQAIQLSVGPGGDCRRWFNEVLTKWKTTRRRPYTWWTILDVLSSPYIDQARLASDIEHQLHVGSELPNTDRSTN